MSSVVEPNAEHDVPRSAADGPQLRTILLTDLVESTALVEQLGDGPAADLFREHDRLVVELQQQWRGRLIDRSDGLLLLFERAIDGLGFALDYNRGLRAIGNSRKVTLQARTGLHVGEVLSWRNSDVAVSLGAKPLEIEGLAKPFAARLMALARPGQILLSAVAEPLAHRAARELGERGEQLLWKSYGRWCFKGIPEAQEIYEVGEAGVAPLRAPKSTAKSWRDIPFWRRPAALGAELLLVAGLATGTWFLTRPQPAIAFGERDWVVVGDLRNLTGDKLLDDSLQQAFRISLEQSRFVNVLSDLKSRDTLALMQRKPGTALDRAIASEIALRDGARAVILPTVSEVGGRVRVSAEVIDPHTQTTVYAESADGNGAASTLDSIDTVTAALRGKLGEALQSIEKDSEPLPRVATSNLDALRAYALGQEAFGLGHYEDAKGFYASAAKMDPQFALAYVGSLRAHNALDDLAGGLPFLRNAQALREHLPPRDQLYLDAWTAEVRSPPEALDKWRRMLALYPDFFPAAANVGYAFYSRNRYADGLPYARRATAPQNAFAPLSWDLVGRLSLGLQRYKDAEHAFGIAATRGSAGARIRLANTFAAQKQFTAAGRIWARVPSADALSFDRVAFYLDQGQLQLAQAQAQALASSTKPQSRLGRAAVYPMAVVAWAGGDAQGALQQLRHVSEEALASSEQAVNASDATDDAYLAIAAAIFAQRMGDTELANMVAKRLQQLAPSKTPQVSALLSVLEANNLRLTHKVDLAIARLESITDGSEPVQAHVALLDAYAASGLTEKALVQARWLTSHRGAAYTENGCGWCQQPLNVFDTTLAHLRAGELLASLNRGSEAKLELEAFDRQWPTQRLPDYLRLRRDALLATFN